MAATSTLYLSANQAILLRAHKDRLAITGVVERAGDDVDAVARLHSLLLRFPLDRVNVVVDVVEEELVVESLPVVGARDLGALVARRLEQRRDRRQLSWAAPRRRFALPGLNRRAGERMPVRIGLLASDAPSQFWLQATIAIGARIDRVTSPGLLAAEVGNRIGRGEDGLLVTVGPAGIRQTLVADGVARFTRLAQLFDTAPRIDPILAECGRTLQYLLMNQVVRRDAIAEDRLRLWLVVDGIVDDRPPPPTLVVDSACSIKVRPVLATDLGAPRSDAPLPALLGAVPLWCDRRLPATVTRGYETAEARRPLVLARLQRTVLAAAGSLAAAAGVAMTTVEVLTLIDRNQSASATNALQRASEERLSQAIAQFPVGGPDMRRLVDADLALQARRLDPQAVLSPVAAALRTSPAIRIERLTWQRLPVPGDPAANGLGAGTAAGLGAGMAAGIEAPPGAAQGAAVDGGLATSGGAPVGDRAGVAGDDGRVPASSVDLLIEGGVRLPATKHEANRAARSFAEAVARGCGCEAAVVRPPYDPDTGTAFTSQVDSERAARAGIALGAGGKADGLADFTVRMRQPTPPGKRGRNHGA